MGEKITFKSFKEMPLCAMSIADMTYNFTGSWRNVRPYYDFKVSPCRLGCPAAEDIQRYIYLATQGDFEQAWKAIIESNPMPSVTGRVCFHPCMEKCTRKDYDQAINIPAVERAIGDMGLDNPKWIKKARATKKEKIAVIGGGPAGLSCAFYLARAGYPVTIFEAAAALGGMLRWGIPEYRLPNELLDRVVQSILESGPITVKTGTALGTDVALDMLEKEYAAVFVGVGLTRSRAMGVAGEEGPGVEHGLEFLRRVNGGEKVDPGKSVVVVGGGNTAMDVARCARRAGSEVTVVYRRTMNEMPAIADEIEEAEKEGVFFHFLAAPKTITRGGSGRVTVVFQQMKLGQPDESGRRRPVPDGDKTFTMEVDKLFTAIGEEGDAASFGKAVETDGALIRTKGAFGETLKAKIFAGGDIVTGAASVVEAIAAGRKAAERIGRMLSKQPEPAAEEPRTISIENINTAYFSKAKRTLPPRISVEAALEGFREIHAGFDEELLGRETARCFSCGVCNFCDNCWVFCPDVAVKRLDDQYEFNYDYCKGCLVCVTECPRSAISTREEGR
ncbi:MAG: NAD(P)-binding protein [Candidatus Krumholzibacteria bacterium]|nr:NAD(P)-binding protein [Candidatus Krumholzibacteria bacterium]